MKGLSSSIADLAVFNENIAACLQRTALPGASVIAKSRSITSWRFSSTMGAVVGRADTGVITTIHEIKGPALKRRTRIKVLSVISK
jgi:hypothetical protein